MRTSVELPDALKIGIPSIDQQHANLLQLLDRFRQGLTLGLTSEPVGDLIYAVGVGLIDHFRAEEEVMDRMDLPDTVAKAHVDDHGQILEDYVALQEHILTFPPTTVAEVIDRIENWIMTHIVAHDLTLRKFVVRQQTCSAELPA